MRQLLYIFVCVCLSMVASSAWSRPSDVTQWGTKGTDSGQFNNPSGIAVDASGNVYVTDSYNFRVQKFSNDGTFIMQWGSYGYGGCRQFTRPTGIAVDPSGWVYVADAYQLVCGAGWSTTIDRFTSTGGCGDVWGNCGWPAKVGGVAVDLSGNFYVTDPTAANLQELDHYQRIIRQWGAPFIFGGPGSELGQFNSPCGVAVDAAGNIYVADWGNRRVQVIQSSGHIVQWPIACQTIAVDAFGNVYTASPNVHHVDVYSSAGAFEMSIGEGLFSYPIGIAADASGNVFVLDNASCTVTRFAPSPTPVRKQSWGQLKTLYR